MEKYFGQFSKIFDALITHKVVVIVIVFFFHCLSIDVALFFLKFISHTFACVVHYYLIYVVRLARLSLCRSLSLCLYCSVVRLARLSLCRSLSS